MLRPPQGLWGRKGRASSLGQPGKQVWLLPHAAWRGQPAGRCRVLVSGRVRAACSGRDALALCMAHLQRGAAGCPHHAAGGRKVQTAKRVCGFGLAPAEQPVRQNRSRHRAAAHGGGTDKGDAPRTGGKRKHEETSVIYDWQSLTRKLPGTRNRHKAAGVFPLRGLH